MSKLSIHRPEEKKEGAPLSGVPERLAGNAEGPRKVEKKAEEKKVAAPKGGTLTGVPERLAGEMDGKCKCGCKGKKGEPGEKKVSVGKKIGKFVLWFVVGLLAFVGILVASSPLWIGPVVTSVANSVVPKYTGTEFNLQEFGFNIYNGRLHVGGLNLANPKGYEAETAVSVGSLDVEGLTVQWKAVKLPVPLPTLTDIGKDSDMDWEDAWNQIVTSVLNSLGNIGEGMKNLGKGIADGAKESAKAMKEGAGKAMDAAGDAVKDVGSAIKGLFK